MSDKTEVIVESMRVSLTSQNRLILLREVGGPLSLPLFVGQFEAESIIIALQEIEISRPQPHDLLRTVIKALGGRMLRAEITEMRSATYIAEIIMEDSSGSEVHIDCRPSDAISLALRAHVPVYVSRSLMDAYGIQPEADVRTKRKPQNTDENPEDEDLSAFRDFFDNINL